MVITNPGGTFSPMRVISHRLAPLPPSSILFLPSPFSNAYTHFRSLVVIVDPRCRPATAGPEAVSDNAAGGRGKYVELQGRGAASPTRARAGNPIRGQAPARSWCGGRPRGLCSRGPRATIARRLCSSRGESAWSSRSAWSASAAWAATWRGASRGPGSAWWRGTRAAGARAGIGGEERVQAVESLAALVAALPPAARSVAHAAGGSPDRGHGRPAARAARQGRRDRGWRQRLLSRQHATCRGARTARHPARGCRRVRRRVGSGERLRPDGRRRGRRPCQRVEPFLRALAPASGARLAALRPERRRALHQDGAQRHRVRPDAGLRRGLRAAARQGRTATSTWRRSRSRGGTAR